jgi:hypothetical protein
MLLVTLSNNVMEISIAMESSVTCYSRVAAVDPFPRGRPVHDVPESSSSGSDVRSSSRHQPSHFVEDCYHALWRPAVPELITTACKRHSAAAGWQRRAHDPARHD